MMQNTLSELLKLLPRERAQLAMALWESLNDGEREAEVALTPEQEAELDRRLAEHLANPASAISWDEVHQKLLGEA
jgi:putative addiction module component (TIGR02574 family)